MAKKLDQILVIDLEATCWLGDPPEGQESDIIEIGLCTLDVATGQRLDKASIVVRPERSTDQRVLHGPYNAHPGRGGPGHLVRRGLQPAADHIPLEGASLGQLWRL